MDDNRLEQLRMWIAERSELDDFELIPASSDASFRRYFRIICNNLDNNKNFIAMDAPPDKENSEPFVAISTILIEAGINAPEVFYSDFKLGFFIISDLGNEQYLAALNNSPDEKLYKSAIDTLLELQQITGDSLLKIANYDQKLLMSEMELFREWYLNRHLEKKLNSDEQQLLSSTFTLLTNSALAQHQVLVHRDYHSRNLMTNKSNPNKPGVLDFQDAVIGPFTYDLVSLLRDCYISLPKHQIVEFALYYKKIALDKKIIPDLTDEEFIKCFDFMGIQRHLKAIGIFSRLNYRDNKPSYLDDIPRTLNYIMDITSNYDEFSEFNNLLEKIHM